MDKLEWLNFDELTASEIKNMITEGIITNRDVVDYYNNEWWDEQP